MTTYTFKIERLHQPIEYALAEVEGNKLLKLQVPRHLQRRGYGTKTLKALMQICPRLQAEKQGNFNDNWLTKHGVNLV